MEKMIIISLIILISIALIGVIIFFLYDNIYQSPVIGENCSIITKNEGENKIDIVFFADGVKKNKINEYVDFFLNSEPFSNYKNKFNFYYVGNEKCEIMEDTLFCYSKDLIKKSSICPNDYIVVLSDNQEEIRSSSYLNVISLNVNHHKNVFLHEFGHTFANLADEYVPSVIPFFSKNCVSKCDNFKEYNIEKCFDGCSKNNYFRSSEESIMRNLKTNNFEKVNTILINKNLDKYE